MTAPTIGPLSVPAQLVIDRCAGNRYYKAAIETPQLLEAIELRAAALRMRRELPLVPAVPLPTAVVDIDGWLEIVAHAGELERARAVKDDALGRLVAKQDALIGSIAANADRALARLNESMSTVMGIAATIVARLGGCANAAAIVASGDPNALDAWQDLRRLRSDEYDAIRTAQAFVMAGDPREIHYRSNWLVDDELATDTAIANLDELFPQWRDRRPGSISISDQPQADPRPWPTDPVEQLVWLVTSGARVWTPTWAQLGELSRRRGRERAHTSSAKQPQQRQQRLNRTPDNSSTTEVLNQEVVPA